jgi:hypothetical protein
MRYRRSRPPAKGALTGAPAGANMSRRGVEGMPANLSPEYKDAQEAYRKAGDPRERLECLREMLWTIPKHKGTEHLQGDTSGRASRS